MDNSPIAGGGNPSAPGIPLEQTQTTVALNPSATDRITPIENSLSSGIAVIDQSSVVPKGSYVAQERLYQDIDGCVVKEGDPTMNSLLAAKGQAIPKEKATALGLLAEDGTSKPVPDTKSRKGPQEDKSVKLGETK